MGGFRKLLWGFMLIFFHIRINGFDLLPDVLGYIIVIIGLGMLASSSGKFETAKWIAIPLAVLSIFTIYVVEGDTNNVFNLFGLLYGALQIMLVYFICMGIIDVSMKNNEQEMAELARSRWTLYLVMSIAALASFILLFIAPILIIAAMIGSLIAWILFLVLLNKAHADLDNYLQ